MKYLIYCTQAKPYCMVGINGNKTYLDKGGKHSIYCPDFNYIGNGKIVATFDCDKVEGIKYHFAHYDMGEWAECYILEKSCLTAEQLDNYLKASCEYDEKKPSKVYGYAIHIKNLKVFDKPLELNECDKNITNVYINDKLVMRQNIQVDKAPQNMCYVWYKGEKYVLISIRSPYVCDIMNGIKTIEIRKKVLKEMIK